MKIDLLGISPWRKVADAARTTVKLDAGSGTPSSSWKRRILLAEHSPIRLLRITWKWYNLLWWVQTHFTRHHVGVEWFVSTSRSDRTGVDRSYIGQNSPVDVEGEANAQAIINISRKRLCYQTSQETRHAWNDFLNSFKTEEPELYRCCVPECVYRGWCYEMYTCKWFKTANYEKALKHYREGINYEK